MIRSTWRWPPWPWGRHSRRGHVSPGPALVAPPEAPDWASCSQDRRSSRPVQAHNGHFTDKCEQTGSRIRPTTVNGR